MSDQVFDHQSTLSAGAETVFAFHMQPGALERLTPPWEKVSVLERHGGISDGGTVVLAAGLGPLKLKWVARHRGFLPGLEFIDEQVSGPFARWVHTHRVEPTHDGKALLIDHIEYRLPLGALGRAIAGPLVRAKLERMFAYRHRVTQMDCETAQSARTKSGVAALENIAITGASGLVGGALVPLLGAAGSRVHPLVRQASSNPLAIRWDVEKGELDAAKLEGIDAVIHLAGENIAGRWSAAKKKAILESRVKSTRLLCEALAKLKRKPSVLISASATGFYGERGGEILDESSPVGSGFLADVCKQWEAAAQPARDAGIRVVHPRIGVVLSAKGGALAKMLTPFKFCLGGRIGSGSQYWSWIALEDVLGAIVHALKTPSVAGALNLTAPNPATNADFTQALGKVLSRPTIFPVPAFAARLALGEMADALLLTSTRAQPKKLLESHYKFKLPDLDSALRHALGK